MEMAVQAHVLLKQGGTVVMVITILLTYAGL